ncbi:hypothetical protein QCA50_020019 [Cerrena zonata]|uniref:Uncharacterized protein n=1 Tax=Cerrena zonata TaxID=2478898 RepID=A0AAW0FK12_9APHY
MKPKIRATIQWLRATTVFDRAWKFLDTPRAESALNTQLIAKSLNYAHTAARPR